VLLGSQEGLEQARRILEERENAEAEEKTFRVAELTIPEDSAWAGKTLADLDLRRRQGISVIGIQRGEQRTISPPPEEVLQPADTLLVIGHPDAIRACQKQSGA
jgi:CPA2 family monovalent cation:H+ antiporter-2